jgi:hypothetical protein
MKKYPWFGLLGLMFSQSALAQTSKFNEAVKNITKDLYFGYAYSRLNYNLNSSGAAGSPDTSASIQTLVIGRHLNDRTALELNMLYKSSHDSFNDSGDIATLGHSFDMEVKITTPSIFMALPTVMISMTRMALSVGHAYAIWIRTTILRKAVA